VISLSDVIDFCRAEALAGKLYPSDVSDWRWFCREYSKTFHTPLDLVMVMEPEHVILCVLEEGLDSRRLKNKDDAKAVIDELRRLEDPDYEATKAKEMDDWAVGIEDWEDDRVASGAPLPKKIKVGQKIEEPKELPKEGGINLSYLQEEEINADNDFQEE
jgi:hypothetical protein